MKSKVRDVFSEVWNEARRAGLEELSGNDWAIFLKNLDDIRNSHKGDPEPVFNLCRNLCLDVITFYENLKGEKYHE